MKPSLPTPERSQKRGHRYNPEKFPKVELTRTFDAPVDRVILAWSDPEMLRQWWGPKGYSCPYAKTDFKVGGTVHWCMRSSKGEEMWSTGVFKEIIPRKKIVFTDQFADKDGNIITPKEAGMKGAEDWPGHALITVEFSFADDEQTEMKLTHEGIPASMHDDCVAGWDESFDKFQRVVERS
jgi:uncharacterized protein YndB with AHSA1/START domain